MTERIKFDQEFFDTKIKTPEAYEQIVDYVEARPPGQTERSAVTSAFPNLPKKSVSEALLVDEDKLKYQNALKKLLGPWLTLPSPGELPLPTFTAIELSRETGLSANTILKLTRSNDIRFKYKGEEMKAATSLPPLPTTKTVVTTALFRNPNKKNKLVPRKVKKLYTVNFSLVGRILAAKLNDEIVTETETEGINPKRLLRRSMNRQYTPGSTSVMRTRINQAKASRLLPLLANEKARIRFEPVSQKESVVKAGTSPESSFSQSLDVQQQLDTSPAQKRSSNLEALKLIIKEPKNKEILDVYKWLRTQGTRKNWILGNNEALLAENLIKLANGKPVDFLIWNCMGFYWTKGWQKKFPSVEVVPNIGESIALYYKSRLQEISKILSPIGPPTFTVLLPSNEVFDQGYSALGLYKQSVSERQEVIRRTKDGILQRLEREAPDLPIEVLTWQEYLKKSSAPKSQIEYTALGNKELTTSPRFRTIKFEMLRSAQEKFLEKGISLDNETLLAIQEAYYSMYTGEGVAFAEFSQSGRNLAILNFEEMRVPQLEYLGAEGNITILTPIKANQMKEFYQWKNEQIRARNEAITKERGI